MDELGIAHVIFQVEDNGAPGLVSYRRDGLHLNERGYVRRAAYLERSGYL